ncbi:MAG TPA: sigma-70 family RNA polymerase sigma factor [Thermoleophilaceae bacterium]|jgi:RNA polymerase sigma factor (sigma-70 family)
MTTERALEHDYVALRRKVTGFLAGRYPQLDGHAREDIYQDAWVALLEARARGHVAREKWISYLLSAARNLGAEALRCADRRRRVSYDPAGAAFVALADAAESPEERAVVLDTGRELLGRLSPGERAVAVCRLLYGYEKREVCRTLGLSPRAYKRRVDKAAIKLRELRAGRMGGLTEHEERLLARCVYGGATAAQRAAAERLVKTAAGRLALARLRQRARELARRPSPPSCSRRSRRLSTTATPRAARRLSPSRPGTAA